MTIGRRYSFLPMPTASQKIVDAATSTLFDFGDSKAVNQIKFKEDDEDSSLKFTPFIIRLHLIRHGETLANLRNIVLGQGDSPLTGELYIIYIYILFETCSSNCFMIR